jgi:YVTN family beta-propeller protein
MERPLIRRAPLACLLLASCTTAGERERAAASPAALAQGELLPSGARITPLLVPGSSYQELDPQIAGAPAFRANQPTTLAVSPDGTTLLLLTSGFNRFDRPHGDTALVAQFVFVYDLAGPLPAVRQVVQLPEAFLGLAWTQDGKGFFVSGGARDEVHLFLAGEGGRFAERLPALRLGHAAGLGVEVRPMVAGLSLADAGRLLLVANYENDSITVIDLPKQQSLLQAGLPTEPALTEVELRPGRVDPALRGQPGGEFPVAIAARGLRAWVACLRDAEVVELDLARTPPAVVRRIKVGAQPTALLLGRRGLRLFVASAGSDTVQVIDTGSGAVVQSISTVAQEPLAPRLRGLQGANPNSLALSADGALLLVGNGGTNSVALLRLDRDPVQLEGLLPTGWYPHAVAVAPRGRLLVATGKSNTGPAPGACRDSLLSGTGRVADWPALAGEACNEHNQFVLQLTHGGLSSLPLPAPEQLPRLTAQVLHNNRLDARGEGGDLFAFLRQQVHHVVYVVKENRSYDQVLGDLGRGNGDPHLALFPEPITPNQHQLARRFVTLDNFRDSGGVSGDGWNWSTAGRTSDLTEKEVPPSYAGLGFSYDFEGAPRNVNIGFADLAERRRRSPETPDDPDLLPGGEDPAQPGGEAGSGYLWSAALRRGLSLRNYGFFGDDRRCRPGRPGYLPPSRHAFAEKALQFVATKAELQAVSDPYFRTFDMTVPDLWNLEEWERELRGYEARGELPALMLVRLAHDHLGSFATARDGVNTPEAQVADNDYALGRLVQRISQGPFAADTVVIAIEDDAQDGPDHVDAHRSLCLVAGARVRREVVVSTAYTTVNVLRTIEELLGLQPLGLTDGTAAPMTDLFQREAVPWAVEAKVPAVLRSTRLSLPQPGPGEQPAHPRRGARWWERATRGFQFSRADAVDPERLNEVLWRGLKGPLPGPARRP